MAQMVSSSPLASAFRCCQHDLREASNPVATKLSELFEHLRGFEKADAAGKSALMMTALKAIRALSATLKDATFRPRDLSLNPKIQCCYDDGVEIVVSIQRSKTALALSQTANKIKELALAHLPPDDSILETLVAQANAQTSSIKAIELCSGLCGIHEIVAHRPHLSMHAAFPKSLAHIAGITNKLQTSFAEVGFNVQKKEEGYFLLTELAKQVAKYQKILKNLCAPDSSASMLIDALVTLNAHPEDLKPLFDSLRGALIDACYECGLTQANSSGVTPQHITQLFEIQAKVAADALPDHLKPDHVQTGQALANVFKDFENHHGYVGFGLTSGVLPYYHEQTWGSSIPHNLDATPVNGANPEGESINDALREQILKLTTSIVYNYYQNHTLISERYEIIDGIIIPIPLDESSRAQTTVNMVVDYEVEQEARGRLFGLELNQRLELQVLKTKQVVLFGIAYDIFSPTQVLGLLLKFPDLVGDLEIGQAMGAALARQLQRQRRAAEVDRFPEADVEALRFMNLPTAAADEEEFEKFMNMPTAAEEV